MIPCMSHLGKVTMMETKTKHWLPEAGNGGEVSTTKGHPLHASNNYET